MQMITEYSGSRRARQKLFSQAGTIAVKEAKNNNLPITYAENNLVIKEYPDGKKEILSVIDTVQICIPKKFKIK